VALSHGHIDHFGGLPDIRSYTDAAAEPMDVYGSGETLNTVWHSKIKFSPIGAAHNLYYVYKHDYVIRTVQSVNVEPKDIINI
jgi:metal-dependent hydrolase (beta-lactamase superfamily II)